MFATNKLQANMKRWILLVAFAALCFTAQAQYATSGVLKRSGTHLKLDGVKLTPQEQATLLSDIDGTDYTRTWDKAKAWRNTGIGLTIGGGVAAVGGMGVALVGLLTSAFGATAGAVVGSIGGQESSQQAAQKGADAGKPYITGGTVAALVGTAALAAGIPLIVVNCHKLNSVVHTYNGKRPVPQVQLGSTPNGVGAQLVF